MGYPAKSKSKNSLSPAFPFIMAYEKKGRPVKESFCFCFWPDSPFVALIRKAGERPITPFGNVLLKGKPVEVDRF